MSTLAYLGSVILCYVTIWIIRISITRKYQRCHTNGDYLAAATWSEVILVGILSLIPGINMMVGVVCALFIMFALAVNAFNTTFNKPLRKQQ